MTEKPQNREAWLTAFAKQVEPLIRKRTGLKLPAYRIAWVKDAA